MPSHKSSRRKEEEEEENKFKDPYRVQQKPAPHIYFIRVHAYKSSQRKEALIMIEVSQDVQHVSNWSVPIRQYICHRLHYKAIRKQTLHPYSRAEETTE